VDIYCADVVHARLEYALLDRQASKQRAEHAHHHSFCSKDSLHRAQNDDAELKQIKPQPVSPLSSV
jgi:hypothetical protein